MIDLLLVGTVFVIYTIITLSSGRNDVSLNLLFLFIAFLEAKRQGKYGSGVLSALIVLLPLVHAILHKSPLPTEVLLHSIVLVITVGYARRSDTSKQSRRHNDTNTNIVRVLLAIHVIESIATFVLGPLVSWNSTLLFSLSVVASVVFTAHEVFHLTMSELELTMLQHGATFVVCLMHSRGVHRSNAVESNRSSMATGALKPGSSDILYSSLSFAPTEGRFGCSECLSVATVGVTCTLILLAAYSIIQRIIGRLSGEFLSKDRGNITSRPGRLLRTTADDRSLLIQRIALFTVVMVVGTTYLTLPVLQEVIIDHQHPIYWMIDFLLSDGYIRIFLCSYWVSCILIGITSAYLAATTFVTWPRICNRKIFHFLMVAIIAPGLYFSFFISFTILATAVALCLFIAVEVFRNAVLVGAAATASDSVTSHNASARSSTLHSSSSCYDDAGGDNSDKRKNSGTKSNKQSHHQDEDAVTSFFSLFMDERDANRPWVSSHISLLIGCALPAYLYTVWCNEVGHGKTDPNNRKLRAIVGLILPHLGWVTVGVGDSFGAIIGSTFGKWKWSRAVAGTTTTTRAMVGAGTGTGAVAGISTARTIEGSIAVFSSMVIALGLVILAQQSQLRQLTLYRTDITSTAAAGADVGVGAASTAELASILSENDTFVGVIIPSVGITLVLTTLLEAFTMENDNLGLPLFASVAFVSLVAAIIGNGNT